MECWNRARTMKKPTDAELSQQYRSRAGMLVKLIGKHYGSGNRKRTQRVFREPSKLARWAVGAAPIIPTGSRARMVILSPIHWVYLAGIVLLVRYLDRRRMTLEGEEKAYKSAVKAQIDKDDGLLDDLVDVDAIRKYDGRIAGDAEYGGDDSRNLRHRARATLVSVLLGTPRDVGYPRVPTGMAKQYRWQQWLGLRDGDSPVRVLWKAFRSGMTAPRDKIIDIFSYLTAGDIAKEQGYNRGRLSQKTLNQLVINEVAHKAGTDADGNVDVETISDPHSLDHVARLEDSDREAVFEALASKGISYDDLTPGEWEEVFERYDLIRKGYEFSSKKGVSIGSYYGIDAHAKEQKWSRLKKKARSRATPPQ